MDLPRGFLVCQTRFAHLRPDAPGAQELMEVLRSIPVVGGDNPQPFPRTSSLACPQVDGIQPRQHLGALAPIGKGGYGSPGACLPRPEDSG
jgi:hypothetical protein